MSEQQTTEAQQTTDTAQQTQDDGAEIKVREHPAFRAVTQQLADLKKQINAHNKERAELDAARKAEADRKAIEAKEFESVLKGRDAQIAELTAKAAAQDAAMKRGEAERALMSAGVTSAIMRKGLLADWQEAQPEDLNEWIAAAKRATPEAFAPMKTPMAPGPVGNAAAGENGSSLEARLQSADRKIREAALKERLAAGLSGL